MEAEDVDWDADDINSSNFDEEDDQTERPIPNSWNQTPYPSLSHLCVFTF
jgi:hypothetical protein